MICIFALLLVMTIRYCYAREQSMLNTFHTYIYFRLLEADFDKNFTFDIQFGKLFEVAIYLEEFSKQFIV